MSRQQSCLKGERDTLNAYAQQNTIHAHKMLWTIKSACPLTAPLPLGSLRDARAPRRPKTPHTQVITKGPQRVDPGMPISPESASITGMSDADVAGVAPRWADVAEEVRASARPAVHVCLLVSARTPRPERRCSNLREWRVGKGGLSTGSGRAQCVDANLPLCKGLGRVRAPLAHSVVAGVP